MNFQDLQLTAPLLQAIDDLGYETPTEIQQKAIPVLLEGECDFVGMAQTGSGKTAAFVLPLLQRLIPNGKIQAIILTPSRELAKQIDAEIRILSKHTKLSSTAIYGGVSYDKQIGSIRKQKPEIIVGTPGRVTDLINQKILNFSGVRTCILDEADEMLRMGFFDSVLKIISFLDEERRIWMFSATMPNEISRLINKEFKEPITVKIKKDENTVDTIDQKYYLIDRRRRSEALQRILQTEECYGIVFCKTKQDTRELNDRLLEQGYKSECLNGDLTQAMRENALDKFRRRKVTILVCTDVAARGIDIKDITHVFNFGLPQDTESYIHRVGRTGRAGKTGTAITLIAPSELRALERIAHIHKVKVTNFVMPSNDEVKSRIIKANLEKMSKIVEAVVEKGTGYEVDSSFEVFSKFFSELDKESLEKVMFTYIFNKELRSIDELGELKASARGDRGPARNRVRARSRRDSGGSRDRRSGGGDGERRSYRGGRDGGGDGERRSRASAGGRDARGGGGNSPSARRRKSNNERSENSQSRSQA